MKLSIIFLLVCISYVTCKAIDDSQSLKVEDVDENVLKQQMEEIAAGGNVGDTTGDDTTGEGVGDVVRERRHPAAYEGVEPNARLLQLNQPFQKTLSLSMGPPPPHPHPVPVQPVISGYSLTPVYGPPPPPPIVIPQPHTYAVPVPVAPPPPPVHHHTYAIPVPVPPPPPPPVHHTYIQHLPPPPPPPPAHHDHIVYLAQPPPQPPPLPPCPHASPPYPPPSYPPIYYRAAKSNNDFNLDQNNPNYVPMSMVYQNLIARAANSPDGWNAIDSNIDDYSPHNMLIPPRKREADIDVQNIN